MIKMKFYLSSYKLGDRKEEFFKLAEGRRIAYIPNALDHVPEPLRSESNARDMKEVSGLGIRIEMLDLRDFFGKGDELETALKDFGGVYVRGGNTFVLRQAMKISGFDKQIKKVKDKNFLYSGYSAGVCVLAPSLKALQNVDDPCVFPYEEMQEVIWEGLGMLDYIVLPHYRSDHPESGYIDKEVEYCKKNDIAFKALRDGEVIIIDEHRKK